MNKYVGLRRRVSTVHPSFPISGSSGDTIDTRLPRAAHYYASFKCKYGSARAIAAGSHHLSELLCPVGDKYGQTVNLPARLIADWGHDCPLPIPGGARSLDIPNHCLPAVTYLDPFDPNNLGTAAAKAAHRLNLGGKRIQ